MGLGLGMPPIPQHSHPLLTFRKFSIWNLQINEMVELRMNWFSINGIFLPWEFPGRDLHKGLD